MICTGRWGPLLSFGHLPLKGKTQHWEYSGFEVFLVSSRVYGPLRRQVNANGWATSSFVAFKQSPWSATVAVNANGWVTSSFVAFKQSPRSAMVTGQRKRLGSKSFGVRRVEFLRTAKYEE